MGSGCSLEMTEVGFHSIDLIWKNKLINTKQKKIKYYKGTMSKILKKK